MKNLLLALSRYFATVPGKLRPHSKIVLILALLSTVFMGFGANRFSLDFSIESWFQKGDPALEALDEFRQQFGSDDGLFIVYEAKDGDVFSHQSLTLIAELTDALDNAAEIDPKISMDKYGLTLEQVEILGRIKRVQSLTNIRIQQSEGDTLSAPLLVPRDIPSSQQDLNQIKALADAQSMLPLFMFSKDHRFGALSITTDFGTIPIIAKENQSDSLLAEDGLAGDFDDFDATLDESAIVEKVKFKELDPSVYLAFMPAVSNIYKQDYFLEQFDFYPIGTAAMTELAWDTMIHAGLLLLGMVVVINLLLWTLFKSASAVVLPQLAIGMSVLFVIGGFGWLNITSSTLIALTGMLVVAVGIADCVHVMSSYMFFRREGETHEEALSHAYAKTGVPILLTTITTMAGMASLAVTGMAQFANFGLSSAAGVLMAFLYTIYLLPVLLDYWHPMPIAKQKKQQAKGVFGQIRRLINGTTHLLCLLIKPLQLIARKLGLVWLLSAEWLQPLLDKIPAFVERRRHTIVVVFVGIFAACVYGATQVKIDSNLVEIFSEDVPIRAAYDIVDEHMMGSGNMLIMIKMGESDALMDPEVLRAMSDLQVTLKRNYGDYIIRSNSLADIVKETHAIMQGDDRYRTIPNDSVMVSQLLYLFNNANVEERSALVSDDYSKSHISVQLRNAGSAEYALFFDDIQRDIDSAFAGLKNRYPEMQVQMTGSFALIMKMADDLSHSQFRSLAIAAVVISALLMITLGSLQAGVMSIIPNLIPATLAFGLMGLLDIPLDTDTLIIAPLIIGIAVDDTIHFISHYRMALVATNSMKIALIDAIKEVGQAVTFTTLILACGFFMLSFSDHLGLVKIGTFGSLAIFVALLCDLLFFPALIMIFKPKFGEKNVDDNLNFNEA